MSEIIVFDFDKTLTLRDTLTGFYLKCNRERRFPYLRRFIYFFVQILYKTGLITNDRLKSCGIRIFLKGLAIQDYKKMCQEYSHSIQWNPEVMRILQNRQKSGYDIWIMTASFEDYVKASLNVTVVGTKLRFKDNVVTDLLRNNYGDEKKKFLISQLNGREIIEFYTDHYSDYPAASLSQSAFLVRGTSVKKIKIK
jgi:HAD superfamily phosphoserine phosphatase-like hydrolase